MMASTVEAIAAAAYLDGGEDAMAAVMRAMQLTDSRLEIAATLVTFKKPPWFPIPLVNRARYAGSLMWLPGPPPIAGLHAMPHAGD